MLLLSRLIGRPVRTPDGRILGSLGDLTVRLGDQQGLTLIDKVLVQRRRQRALLLPWTAVAAFAHNDIRVADDTSSFSVESIGEALEADELLLGRDVLDTQIVDIAGQRLARVADVVLAHRNGGRIEVVGVEVGFGAVLRRLGLERLSDWIRRDAVAWSDLHLTSERGHSVQLATPRSAVHLLNARGLAMLVARLDIESATEVLAARGPGVAADVIQASHPVVGERMLRAMPENQAAEVVSVMPTSHATRWRRTLATRRHLRGRSLLRSHVWPRRRHTAPELRR